MERINTHFRNPDLGIPLMAIPITLSLQKIVKSPRKSRLLQLTKNTSEKLLDYKKLFELKLVME